MAARPRKRTPVAAPEEPESPPSQVPPAVQSPSEEVVAPETSKAIPPIAYAPVVLPRNEQDVVHNLIVRQLTEDLANPPDAVPDNPALQVLSELNRARQEGKPLEAIRAKIDRELAGGPEMDSLVWHLYRRSRASKLVAWLQADDILDRFLLRLFKRGDLTPTEALILKRMSQAEIKDLVAELGTELKDSTAPEVNIEMAFTKIDHTLTTTRTETQKFLDKTTPQGREIVRKLIFTARQKVSRA